MPEPRITSSFRSSDRSRSQARPPVPSVLGGTFDPALRRVPAADGRDPWTTPPPRLDDPPRLEEIGAKRRRRYRLAWDERVVDEQGPRQVRLMVPLLGPYPPPDFGYRLGRELYRLWVGGSRVSTPGVSAVAAHVRHTRGQRRLVVLITLGPGVRLEQADGPMLARGLDEALLTCSDHASGEDDRHGPLRVSPAYTRPPRH